MKIKVETSWKKFQGWFWKKRDFPKEKSCGITFALNFFEEFFPTSGCIDSFHEKSSLILRMDNRPTPWPQCLFCTLFIAFLNFAKGPVLLLHAYMALYSTESVSFLQASWISSCVWHTESTVCPRSAGQQVRNRGCSCRHIYPRWGWRGKTWALNLLYVPQHMCLGLNQGLTLYQLVGQVTLLSSPAD